VGPRFKAHAHASPLHVHLVWQGCKPGQLIEGESSEMLESRKFLEKPLDNDHFEGLDQEWWTDRGPGIKKVG